MSPGRPPIRVVEPMLVAVMPLPVSTLPTMRCPGSAGPRPALGRGWLFLADPWPSSSSSMSGWSMGLMRMRSAMNARMRW